MLPQHTLQQGWNSAHGLTMDMMVRVKSMPMLKAGLELNYGMYASTIQTQEHIFRDGTTTVTDIQFSSSIASIGGKAVVESPKPKTVKPYGSILFGGLSMFSDLFIEDPCNPLGCRALEARPGKRYYLVYGTWWRGKIWHERPQAPRAQLSGSWIQLSDRWSIAICQYEPYSPAWSYRPCQKRCNAGYCTLHQCKHQQNT